MQKLPLRGFSTSLYVNNKAVFTLGIKLDYEVLYKLRTKYSGLKMYLIIDQLTIWSQF